MLQYVHNQTEELCLEALKTSIHALNFINPSFFENIETNDNVSRNIITIDGKKYELIQLNEEK